MSPEQCRAARGWLDWSQGRLARAADLPLAVIRDFENGRRKPTGDRVAVIERALRTQGVIFTTNGIAASALNTRRRQ
jgi:ribosome-binding protein aMBF1 (putative translation factor)